MLYCLVPVRRLLWPSRSIHFGDVSEENWRENGLTSSLGRDPKRIGRVARCLIGHFEFGLKTG